MLEFKFRRQHPFGDYIIDFVCLEAMLAIEVDGGQHNAHQAKDTARTEYLKRAGFRVLRFWNNEVLSDIESVTAVIWRALQEPYPTPIPAFPLKGKELSCCGCQVVMHAEFNMPVASDSTPRNVPCAILPSGMSLAMAGMNMRTTA